MKEKKYDLAEKILLEIKKLFPTNINSYIGLGMIYSEQNKYNLAEKYLLEAKNLFPDNIKVYYGLLEMYLRQEKYRLAEETLRELSNSSFNKFAMYIGLIKIHIKEKKYELAIKVFKEAISSSLNKKIELYLFIAKELTRQKQYPLAEEILLEAKQLFTNNINIYIELSDIYVKENKDDLAEEILLEAKQLFPNNINSYIELGKIYSKKKKYDSLKNILNEAKFLDESSIFINLGNLYFNQKEYTLAKENYNKALKLSPKNLNAHQELIKLYIKEKNYDLAEKNLKKYNSVLKISDSKFMGKILITLILVGKDYKEHIKNIIKQNLYLKAQILDEIIEIYNGKRDNEISNKTPDELKKELGEKIINSSTITKDLKNYFKRKENYEVTGKIFYMYKSISKYIIENLVCENIFKNNVDKFNDPFDPYFKRYDKNLNLIKELKKIRITCFSKEKNNLLLWAHYGDNHKGICLGYELDKIDKNESFLVKLSIKE